MPAFSSHLVRAISATDSQIQVADHPDYWEYPCLIRIVDELLSVTGGIAGGMWLVDRGMHGSVPVAHPAGATVARIFQVLSETPAAANSGGGTPGPKGDKGDPGEPGQQGTTGLPGTTLHSGLSDVTPNQHHAQLHAAAHAAGQGDALTAGAIGAAASAHAHAESEVTNLVGDLAGKAAVGHGHVDADIPAGIARDTEVTTAVANHAAASDPHPGYAADTDLSAHGAAADPHPGYLTPTEGNAAYSPTGHAHPHASTTGQTANDHHAQLHAAAHVPGGGDALAVDAAVGVGSLRTLGSGATQAAAGTHTHPGGSAADPPQGSYAPGSFTVTTGKFALLTARLQLTGAQRMTAQGTARVRIT